MMTDFWTTILEFCYATTERVGNQLVKDFGQVQAIQKSDGSLVTQSDKWADGELTKAIASSFPGYGILSEESEQVFPGTEWCWVIDPVDGTTNFTRGLPIWGISLGLLYQGVPVFGFVYIPTLRQSFYGFWGGDSDLKLPTGAYLNNRLITASPNKPDNHHFFSVCSRSTSVIQPNFPCKIRMYGVASYNFLTVANGSTLGAVEVSPKVWDLAGAWPILKAANATWVSLKSDPFPLIAGENYIARSFPTLAISHPELLDIFKPFLKNIIH